MDITYLYQNNSQPFYYFLTKYIGVKKPKNIPYHETWFKYDKYEILKLDLPIINNKYKNMSKNKSIQVSSILDYLKRKNILINSVQEICCGKAHLGKIIAENLNVKLIGCDINTNLLDQIKYPILETYQIDILKDKINFDNNNLNIALHACGQLHDNIIKQFADFNQGYLFIVPCCYPKFRNKIEWLYYKYESLPNSIGKMIISNSKKDETNKIKKRQIIIIIYNLIIKKFTKYFLNNDNKWLFKDGYVPIPDYIYKKIKKLSIFDQLKFIFQTSNFQISIPFKQIIENINYVNIIKKSKYILKEIEIVDKKLFPYLKNKFEELIIDDRKKYLEHKGFKVEIGQIVNKDITPRNYFIFAHK